jgi:hypothetical protein
MAKLTMVQAINLALRQEMASDPDVVVLGEDVGVDGGVFRVTEGLLEQLAPIASSIPRWPRPASSGRRSVWRCMG